MSDDYQLIIGKAELDLFDGIPPASVRSYEVDNVGWAVGVETYDSVDLCSTECRDRWLEEWSDTLEGEPYETSDDGDRTVFLGRIEATDRHFVEVVQYDEPEYPPETRPVVCQICGAIVAPYLCDTCAEPVAEKVGEIEETLFGPYQPTYWFHLNGDKPDHEAGVAN